MTQTKHASKQALIDDVIAVGAAYRPLRDARDILGTLFSLGMALIAVSALAYTAAIDRWSPAAVALIIGTCLSALAAALVPWSKLRRQWQLVPYVAALAAIIAAVQIYDVSAFALLLLLPMMALTSFFWDSRRTVVAGLVVAALAFAVPVVAGQSSDAMSALIITLPALTTVALLAGMLAARFNTMRIAERRRYKATIEALSTALTARDGYTGSHSEETLWLVSAICDELRVGGTVKEYVADVALLHDIGKIGIPNEVLHEPGKLNDEQWEIMKQHPVIGERIVITVPGLEEVARAIRHEHERWDGGGYPDGLTAGQIPLASRIVLVCDAFHAMTSDRPYRKAMPVSEARLELARHAGSQFDPTIVGALLNVLDRDLAAPGTRRVRAPRAAFSTPLQMTERPRRAPEHPQSRIVAITTFSACLRGLSLAYFKCSEKFRASGGPEGTGGDRNDLGLVV